MDIMEYEGRTIAVFEGNITTLPPTGFVIYGVQGKYMLAYADDCGVLTLNSTPYLSLESAMAALKVLFEESR